MQALDSEDSGDHGKHSEHHGKDNGHHGQLDSGDTLTDEVVIQSADGTEQTIEITINGLDEEKGNPKGQTVDGTRGDDTITTGNGSDIVNGLPGDDVISTGNQDDFVQAGSGDDIVNGGNGKDTISGDAGNDVINGDNGNDILLGGTGNDQIFGGNGNDLLDPGDGFDIMTGGNGSDVFVFDLDGARDEVTDFEDGVDQIRPSRGSRLLTSSSRTAQGEGSQSASMGSTRCFSRTLPMRHSSRPTTSFVTT